MTGAWRAIVLAAGRGPDDPLARAFGVTHKCAIPLAGVPMLRRVVDTLTSHPAVTAITVSIDEPAIAAQLLDNCTGKPTVVRSEHSAAASAAAAAREQRGRYPLLLTTADHPLLDHAMLDFFMSGCLSSGADLCVGLATAETILAAYPDARRTFLTFGRDRVSGCNLFALMNERALAALAFWSSLDRLRKQPWRLVGAFGVIPLLRYATGSISLQSAFALASKRLALRAVPVLMPYAEAAIDVDKPADKDQAEAILRNRAGVTI
jgi:GTP:adenosylcobinamide-phosphate guanylyltransferase